MKRNLSLSCAAALLLCVLAGTNLAAQSEQPSLADIARQKSAAKAKKVVTNDEIPPSPEADKSLSTPAIGTSASGKTAPAANKDTAANSQPASNTQSKIQELTAESNNLQKVIKQLQDKIAATNDPDLTNTLSQVLQHAQEALADNEAQLAKVKAGGAAAAQASENPPPANQDAPSPQTQPK